MVRVDDAAQAFLFADLAGYSTLTEAHGDVHAVQLVDEFCGEVRDLLPRHGAHEVKAIGDALLIRAPDAGQAIMLGLEIADTVGFRHGFLSVRVGMHYGPAVERGGDWFGHTVNIAARVAALAGGGEVLVTEDTVAAAGRLVSVSYANRGLVQLKGIQAPVRVLLAVTDARDAPESLPIDPVCRMSVEPSRAAGRLIHGGHIYYFCSLACAGRFTQDPGSFAQQLEPGRGDGGGGSGPPGRPVAEEQ